MILKAENGEIFSEGRTNEAGDLSFSVNENENYQIEVKGTFFSGITAYGFFACRINCSS